MRALLVATLTREPGSDLLSWLSARADWLEWRADLAGDVDAGALRASFRGKLLYTLRSEEEGGGAAAAGEDRARRLVAAAHAFDLVDLEANRDLRPEVLAALPASRRVLSWHGGATRLLDLKECFDRLAAVPARLYKVVVEAEAPADALVPLQLLKDLGRNDVAAFASGAAGAWTRLVAPRLGAPVVYGAAWGPPGAPGQPPLARLCEDFGLPDLPPVESLLGIVGNPVRDSLSPRLHNAAYRRLGLPALYLPFEAESFGDFWLDLVEGDGPRALGLPLTGLSVTAPFKDVALAVAGASSPLAQRVGGANTLVLHDGVWEAETTDSQGVLGPLETRGIRVAGRRAAVLGVGGAGRAVALGLALAGASVTLVNRGERRGRRAAAELGLPYQALDTFDPAGFDLLIHATPLGRQDGDAQPFDPARPGPGAVVVDLVYRRDEPTPLVAAARSRGLLAVDGREVLLFQARRQFRLMTGRELPLEMGREELGLTAEGP